MAAAVSVDLFIQVQNLYFVPIQRQRLAFAVLVRRALRALEPWTSDDAIAIAVPGSVAAVLHDIIDTHRYTKHFPVKLILCKWPEGDYREVFPVTPCDGLVEAARYASERGIRCESIDLEIAPGNLINRRCMQDPTAAEDELVLGVGISRYLRIVDRELAIPPARFDPVDSLREVHIAEQLQRLAPSCRRALVVCDVVNFDGIKRHISVPSRRLSQEQALKPAMSVSVVEPNLPVMLSYLDDFPRLTQRFEEMRADGTAEQFDKFSALLEVLQKIGAQAGEGYQSIRRIEVFMSYLRGMLNAHHRRSPRANDVAEAFRGCFGSRRARRLVHELARYGENVDVERVVRTAGSEPDDYALKDRRPLAKEVGRSCNNTPPSFVVRRRPPRAQVARGTGNEEAHGADSANWDQLRRKAIVLIERAERERRAEPFRGSMERGIDARRTLRSHLGPTPGAWVRRYRPPSVTHNLENEPIVWIFELSERLNSWSTSGQLQCQCVTNRDISYCQSSRFVGNETEIFKSHDGDIRVQMREVLGRLNYLDSDVSVVAKKLGAEFNRRVPVHSAMSTTYPRGCVLDSLIDLATSSIPWWELLIRSALEYAKASVLCVVPDGFRPSSSILSAASERNKRLMFTRVRQFNRFERNRMMKTYSVMLPPSSLDDAAFERRAADCLRDLGIW